MRRALLLTVTTALLTACASGGAGGGGTGGATPEPAAQGGTTTTPRAESPWPVKTRTHIDLWLHGYAMVAEDTTLVPYFKRGYRDRMVVQKNQRNIVTQLDVNRDQLRRRLTANRGLANAQFVPLHFLDWEELQRAMDLLVRSEGDPARASNPTDQQEIALLAQQYFPTPADREWARLFMLSLKDENDKFYREYRLQRERELTPVIAAVDSLWNRVYRPKLQRFLTNTQAPAGSFILSLPLDGEGRSMISAVRGQSTVVTTFPESVDAAAEAIYVFAHEAISNIAGTAVEDNITPNERRTGLGDRYTGAAAVRGGYILLQRTAPDLADGYARYYLRSANVTASANPAADLARVFALPAAILTDIGKQLDVVLGGI